MNHSVPRVCSFESRRGEEMARLIEKFGGRPTIAPSMREVPLADHQEAFRFAEDLFENRLDLVVFMTGVGTTALFETLQTRYALDDVKATLERCRIAVRGPKPAAVLQRQKVRIDVKAPEPNTWQELASELERQEVGAGPGARLAGKRVAVQEYGEPGTEFHAWLTSRGAEVIPVPIYRWSLPEDLSPLRAAIRGTIAGDFDVLLWTSAQQVIHTLEVAARMGVREEWLAAANRCLVGSIGPTASERLRSVGLTPNLEPSHPKMAHLVRETLAAASGEPRSRN